MTHEDAVEIIRLLKGIDAELILIAIFIIVIMVGSVVRKW